MFLPSNRHLLVTPVDFGKSTASDTGGVLMPEGYQMTKEYEVAKIVSAAHDCLNFCEDSIGHYAVFPGNMLQQVQVNGDNYCLVQENYIMGVYVPSERVDEVGE